MLGNHTWLGCFKFHLLPLLLAYSQPSLVQTKLTILMRLLGDLKKRSIILGTLWKCLITTSCRSRSFAFNDSFWSFSFADNITYDDPNWLLTLSFKTLWCLMELLIYIGTLSVPDHHIYMRGSESCPWPIMNHFEIIGKHLVK